MSIVYLHAIGLDQQMWRGVAGTGALVPDLPGHGSQPRLAEPVTFAALVRHLSTILTGPAHIVGISLGSMLAQHVAVLRPDLVKSLVLACAAPHAPPDIMRQRATDLLASGMAPAVPATLERWFTPEVLQNPDHKGLRYARQRLLQDDPAVIADYWMAISQHDLRDRLSAVTVPTTVIAATGDRSFSLETVRAVASGIPEARFREIAGPHMVPLEEPGRFGELIDEHMRWAGGD